MLNTGMLNTGMLNTGKTDADTSNRKRRGQGTVEYGLILMLIGVAAMLSCEHMGVNVAGYYQSIATKVSSVAGN